MTIKKLRRFARLLNRNDGVSVIAVVAIVVIMSVMGAVFTSIMGNWKVSAPLTINSNKAFFLAESAAMFALQDASNRFFSKNIDGCPDFPDCVPGGPLGTRAFPYNVSNIITASGTETAEFWIERPENSSNPFVDIYLGNDRGSSDDDSAGPDDDLVDDDADDAANPTLYTIIATGKVFRGSPVIPIAKRQIRILATITDKTGPDIILAGVHTDGDIQGGGVVGTLPDLQINKGGQITGYNIGPNVNVSSPAPVNALEANIVYRALPALAALALNEDVFLGLATHQGHDRIGPFPAPHNYPNGDFYFDTLSAVPTMPNVTHISGNLTTSGTDVIYGIYWVTGSVVLTGNPEVHGIIISEGNITLDGGAATEIDGGIINIGANTISSTGSGVDIVVNTGFFNALNAIIPKVNVVSWQEAVSAN